MSQRIWTRWASGEGEGATSWMSGRAAIPLGGAEADYKGCDKFEEIRGDDIDIHGWLKSLLVLSIAFVYLETNP